MSNTFYLNIRLPQLSVCEQLNSDCLDEGLSGRTHTWKLLRDLVSMGHVLSVWYLAEPRNVSPPGQDIAGQTVHLQETRVQSAPVWGGNSCLHKKSFHTWRWDQRCACATAPTKCVSWWPSSKMLWLAGFARLHHSWLWPGALGAAVSKN